MDPIQRTKGRFKAFDSDDDAGQWKTMERLKADKVPPLPGKLTASWEPIGGSFYGMQGWVAIFGLYKSHITLPNLSHITNYL